MRLLSVCGTQALVLLLGVCGWGCSTYDELTREARQQYYRGQYAESERLWNEIKEDNEDWAPLVDLEVGMVRFAEEDYEGASRLLEQADRVLEVLDFTSDMSEVGRYMFSESMEMFRARPYEKIFLSALNLLSYAAREKLPQARTEANLLYSKADGIRELENTTRYDSAFTYLLVGILDEMTEPDRPGQALISYEKALQSLSSKSLQATVERLRAQRAGGAPPGTADSGPGPEDGVLVVFILNGRGPILQQFDQYKLTPEEKAYFRDIVLAETMTRVAATTAQGVSAREVNAFVAANMFYPKLKLAVMRKRPSRYQAATLDVAGTGSFPCEKVLDLERQILQWFDSVRGGIIGAAVSRAAFRMAAGLAAQLAVQHAMKERDRKARKSRRRGSNDHLGSALGSLAGLLVQQALYEIDTPDTRCWTLLPSGVFSQRRVLRRGTYEVSVTMTGAKGARKKLRSRKITIQPGKFTFAVWLCHD